MIEVDRKELPEHYEGQRGGVVAKDEEEDNEGGAFGPNAKYSAEPQLQLPIGHANRLMGMKFSTVRDSSSYCEKNKNPSQSSRISADFITTQMHRHNSLPLGMKGMHLV